MGGEVKALSDRVDVISTDLDCIDEINKLLDQEILLALENWLQYVQWSNGNAELDRLRWFCISYEYVEAKQVRDNAVHGVDEIKPR
ncbi:hypothetical protein Tco_0015962 [Tanacetum coccineum]